MKILVLGAGVIGTATAWYLVKAGHEVTVVDRRTAAGMETSFANGGQISVSHAEPWANPEAPLQLLQWLWRDDSPLLFRLRMDPNQWAWCARFLYECLPGRTRENIRQIVKLSVYSRDSLRQLREETGIAYDQLERGILHYFTDRSAYESAVRSVDMVRSYGLDRELKSVDEAIAIEPALAPARGRIVGATYTATDESGDAFKFTQGLAKLAEARGAKFLFGQPIERIDRARDGVGGIVAGNDVLKADAYVVALGSYSPLLTRPIGVELPVYPAKGYSATVDIVDSARAPTVSLIDDSAKIVFSRLGTRLRIAGTAELSGYSTELNDVRCQALIRRAREIFPGAAQYDRAAFWAGLRPSTPSNVPIVGASKVPRLYLNTGHGTLGWTMACGSGRALADIISGRRPQVDFDFTTA